MTRKDLIRKMGPDSWNEYAVPAMNSALGDFVGREKAAMAVYFEAILPARSKRGLICMNSSFDEIMEKLPSERRKPLRLIIKKKIKDVHQRYTCC